MIDPLKKFIKEKTSALAWFLSGPSGKWFFTRSTLHWMKIASIRRQLPFSYRVFGTYSRLFFKVTRRKHLAGGRQFFILLSGLLRIVSRRDYLNLHLPKYEVYLDQYDPRFLQVVKELTEEPPDMRILTGLLSKGDTFIDVGANHGSFSIVASKLVGNNGCIIAVEPQPHLVGAIEKSLAANCPCSFKVHQIAVGNSDGEIEFLIPRDTSGNAGIYQRHSGIYKHHKVRVPIKRFDEAVNWQSFPDKTVVNLDVEGSEFNFLKGARKMIAVKKPTLIMEINPSSIKKSGTTAQDMKHLLAELGYNRYAEVDAIDKTFPIEDLNTEPQRNVVLFIN